VYLLKVLMTRRATRWSLKRSSSCLRRWECAKT